MKVHEIAHCRTGDKGDYSIVTAIVYDRKNYSFLKERLTAQKVKYLYRELAEGNVTRYECENTGMLIFEMERALGGGVTRSLRHDGHGKNLSNALMEFEMGD
jgi:hypothetical protein